MHMLASHDERCGAAVLVRESACKCTSYEEEFCRQDAWCTGKAQWLATRVRKESQMIDRYSCSVHGLTWLQGFFSLVRKKESVKSGLCFPDPKIRELCNRSINQTDTDCWQSIENSMHPCLPANAHSQAPPTHGETVKTSAWQHTEFRAVTWWIEHADDGQGRFSMVSSFVFACHWLENWHTDRTELTNICNSTTIWLPKSESWIDIVVNQLQESVACVICRKVVGEGEQWSTN